MDRICQHCCDLIVGNACRVTSEEGGITLLDIIVCSPLFYGGKKAWAPYGGNKC
jgi:hypothetical protein